MKQKLLADIELDVHELKYLMDSFSKEPTGALTELLKRSITQMEERLERLREEIESVQAQRAVAEPVPVVEAVAASQEEPSVDSPVQAETPVAESKEEKEEEAAAEAPQAEAPAEAVPPVQSTSGGEVLGESARFVSPNLRRSISLNDSFRFSRELFGGDMEQLNRVVEQLSAMSSYRTAVAFLSSKIELDEEKETVADFLELLKKYFNQPS